MDTLRYVSMSLIPNLLTKLEDKGSSRRDSVTEFEVNCVMVRIQLRTPSPPPLAQRSGVVILDVHGLLLTSRLPLEHREMYPHRPDLKTQSTSPNSNSRDNHVLWAEWQALLIACSSAGAATARVFCSVGPLSSEESEVPSSEEHIRFLDDTSPIRRFACMKLAQNPPLPSGRKGNRSGVFVAEINVPSVYLNLTKPLFDSLQFWIDDVSQLLEQNLVPSSDGTRENSSRNPSLVGSRLFSNSKQGSVDTTVDNASSDHSKSLTEKILKVTISEGENPTFIIHAFSHCT
jgi:autophagy-related protein 2